jgi:hypothetical protein
MKKTTMTKSMRTGSGLEASLCSRQNANPRLTGEPRQRRRTKTPPDRRDRAVLVQPRRIPRHRRRQVSHVLAGEQSLRKAQWFEEERAVFIVVWRCHHEFQECAESKFSREGYFAKKAVAPKKASLKDDGPTRVTMSLGKYRKR